MKYFDPNTFQEVPQGTSYKCTQCGKTSISLYTHNGIGKIPPSCFSCKVKSASDDIFDKDIFY